MSVVKDLRKLLIKIRLIKDNRSHISEEYYQKLHENSEGYQNNNWLIEEIEELLLCAPNTVTEIGCGNGAFLKKVSNKVQHATGLDWAISPKAIGFPDNISFFKCNIISDEIQKSDLICSADVLEHFPVKEIDNIIGKLNKAGRYNFHVIACYDDGHSHLSIFEPAEWLEKFQKTDLSYKLKKVYHRKNKRKRKICIIANF